jgi:hypothetical protein
MRPRPKPSVSKTRWDRVPRRNRLHGRWQPCPSLPFPDRCGGGGIRPAHPAVGPARSSGPDGVRPPSGGAPRASISPALPGAWLCRDLRTREEWPSTRRSGSAGMPCCCVCRPEVPAGRAAPIGGRISPKEISAAAMLRRAAVVLMTEMVPLGSQTPIGWGRSPGGYQDDHDVRFGPRPV